MGKKKYLGKLSLFYGLLFCLLLGFSSTSYAYMSKEYLDYGIETLSNNLITQTSSYQSTMRNILNVIKNHEASKTRILTEINNNLDNLGLADLNDINIIGTAYDNDSSYLKFKIFICNNTAPGSHTELDHYLIKTGYMYPYSRTTTDFLYYIEFNCRLSNGIPEFQTFSSKTLSGTSRTSVYWGNIGFSSSSDTILISTNVFCAGVPGGFAYSPLNSSTNIVPVILQDLNGNYKIPTPDPEEPSGDYTPGGTGTITNNSGDTTGKIDLSGIQNQLGTINNNINDGVDNIIGNQNQNTEAIVGAINNSNENYWGSDEDLDGEEQEDFISDSFDIIVGSVSGELVSNPVFNHLESVEGVFLGFFNNQEDESFYDLIIEWPDVNLYGSRLIEAGSINISQLCRDVPELGRVQQYTRVIFNFGTLIALLWQIYNLVLSTLGIDNPYLYEDAQVTDVVNSDTGEVKSFYRTRKRLYKKR